MVVIIVVIESNHILSDLFPFVALPHSIMKKKQDHHIINIACSLHNEPVRDNFTEEYWALPTRLTLCVPIPPALFSRHSKVCFSYCVQCLRFVSFYAFYAAVVECLLIIENINKY